MNGTPVLSVNFSYSSLKLILAIVSPGLFPSGTEGGFPLRTLVLKGSGNPPAGTPILPFMKSYMLSGKSSFSAFSTTLSSSKLFYTMNKARSPTTLEEGVTLTISPKARLAAA